MDLHHVFTMNDGRGRRCALGRFVFGYGLSCLLGRKWPLQVLTQMSLQRPDARAHGELLRVYGRYSWATRVLSWPFPLA